jgi:hypothetical protein
MGKKEELAELVELRRSETHASYISLSAYDGGFYDLDFVVPWTAGAKNLEASLMIVGQDWISEEFLKKNSQPEKRAARREFGQDAMLPTNINLKRLLKAHFGALFSDTYATDISVFIKPGDMDGDVPMKDLRYFAKKYTLPQIKIVEPRMVLCLGSRAFNAIWRAIDEPQMKLSDACLPTAHTVVEGAEIYGVPHTGSWGSVNAGGDVGVAERWNNLALHLRKLTGGDRSPGPDDRTKSVG